MLKAFQSNSTSQRQGVILKIGIAPDRKKYELVNPEFNDLGEIVDYDGFRLSKRGKIKEPIVTENGQPTKPHDVAAFLEKQIKDYIKSVHPEIPQKEFKVDSYKRWWYPKDHRILSVQLPAEYEDAWSDLRRLLVTAYSKNIDPNPFAFNIKEQSFEPEKTDSQWLVNVGKNRLLHEKENLIKKPKLEQVQQAIVDYLVPRGLKDLK